MSDSVESMFISANFEERTIFLNDLDSDFAKRGVCVSDVSELGCECHSLACCSKCSERTMNRKAQPNFSLMRSRCTLSMKSGSIGAVSHGSPLHRPHMRQNWGAAQFENLCRSRKAELADSH